MLYDEGIKGSKKGITMKILGQISNLLMGLQNTLSLTMILKLKMIQADLNVVGKVKKKYEGYIFGSDKRSLLRNFSIFFKWFNGLIHVFSECRLLYALVFPEKQDHLCLHSLTFTG